MAHGGTRKGTRRAESAPRQSRVPRQALLLAVGITVCVVAWGYLVYAAIDFGSSARAGHGASWWFLALASLGAIACLFVALMLLSRLGSSLGLGGTAARSASTSTPPVTPLSHRLTATSEPEAPRQPRVKGGKRAAR